MAAPVLTNFTKFIAELEADFVEGKAPQVKEQALFCRSVSLAGAIAAGIVAVALTHIALAGARVTFGLSLVLVGPCAAAFGVVSYECYKAACIFNIIIDRANLQPANTSIITSAVPVVFDAARFLVGRMPDWVVRLQRELDSTLILRFFASQKA